MNANNHQATFVLKIYENFPPAAGMFFYIGVANPLSVILNTGSHTC
jgi:hypothetical protein